MKKRIILSVLLIIAMWSGIFGQGSGTCAHFEGNEYMSFGNNYKFSSFSIEMWVYRGDWTVTSTESLISCTQGGGYNIQIKNDSSNDVIRFNYRNSDNTGYSTIDYPVSNLLSGWNHIAVTLDGNAAHLYVSGIDTDGPGSDMTPDKYYAGNDLLLGAEAGDTSTPTGNFFNGYIDEVRIWDAVLTQNQLNQWRHKQILSTQRPANHNHLQGYYKIDASWTGGFLDDAADNVTSNTGIDLINQGASIPTSYAVIGDLPSNYAMDAEALYRATGSGFSEASTGLSQDAANPDIFEENRYLVYANSGLTGTINSYLPYGIEERARTTWFFDEHLDADYEINLKFDVSEFGAGGLIVSGLAADYYKLLKRNGSSGDFTIAASADSLSDGVLTFTDFSGNGNAYYTIGRKAVNDPDTIHCVGELYGGGVVFWVDHTGKHGFIVSMIDQSTYQIWSNVNTPDLIKTDDWNGSHNTYLITHQSGHTQSAAKLCVDYINNDYGTGIYDDWFLPSLGQIIYIWNNFYEINKTIDNDGNSSTTTLEITNYWSSTAFVTYETKGAGFYSFSRGRTNWSNRNSYFNVRAIRAF